MALTRIALFFICIIVIIAEAKGKGKRGHRARKEAQQLRSTAEYYTNKLRFGHDGIRDYFQYETNKERSDRRRRYNYYASGYQHRNKPNHRDRESTYSDSHHKKRNKDGTDGTASFCHNGCQINIDWQMCAAILISGIVMGLICTCLVLMLGWHKFKWKSGNHYSDHMNGSHIGPRYCAVIRNGCRCSNAGRSNDVIEDGGIDWSDDNTQKVPLGVGLKVGVGYNHVRNKTELQRMNMVNESGGGFDQYQRSNNILGDGHSNWIDYNKQTVFLDMEQKGNAGYNQGKKSERGVQTRSMVNETGGIGYEGVTLDSNIKYRDKQDKVEDQLRGMSNLFMGRHCTNGENV